MTLTKVEMIFVTEATYPNKKTNNTQFIYFF